MRSSGKSVLTSPLALAIAGTLAIHTILVVTADAVTVVFPYRPSPPAPRIDLVDVEVPPPPPPAPPKPPPPVIAKPEPEPVDTQPPPVQPQVRRQRVSEPLPQVVPPPETVPTSTDPTPGGDEVVQMADIAPAAVGVAVKQGTGGKGRIGRGGTGGGTGAGSGSGAGEAPPTPVSVATIKKRALPKGDYSYFNTGLDYPPEARQLGIEGPIRVKLIVDDLGRVKSAVLLNRLGHGLDELAMSRAKQILFEPARDTDDRAVASVVVWTFYMTLPK